MHRLYLAVVAAAVLLHLATAALPDVYDELPGQYASTAWEMTESGEWLIPMLEGVPRLQKPPLVYWITAASLSVFGRNEFAARLPTALALSGLILVTYALGERLYGSSRGVIAAGVLGTSLGTVALGKLIMPEPFLALAIAVSLYAVIRTVEAPRQRWWPIVAWLAAALGSLSKGPHALLLPVIVVALVAALRPEIRRSLARLLHPYGLALFLGIVLPWPLYVEHQFPGYLRDNLLNEQLGHILDTHFPRDSEPTPLSLLWSQHLAWWFPWALFAVAAAVNRPVRRAHPLAALPLVWLLTTVVAASLSGQRQDYHTMFAWPAFALLVSRAWDDGADRPRVKLALALPLIALLALGFLGLVAYGLTGSEPARGTSLPFGERNSVLRALTGIAGVEWWRLRPLLPPAAGSLLLGAGGGLALVWRSKRPGWSWMPLAGGSLGLLFAAVLGLQAFAPFFGLKEIALTLEQKARGNAVVFYDGPSHRASSLCFYVSLPVRWLEDAETEFAVRSRGIGNDRFSTEEELIARWRSNEPSWLITEEGRLEIWRDRLGEALGPVVALSGTRLLLGNVTARASTPAPRQ
jgi:4-amino-4-deoxy-L-arabinose transferase-like glycosyltransferase